MSACFADTFFFLALLDRTDQHHARVAAFAQQRGLVLTTRWVLLEVANALGSTPVREQAAQLLQRIEGEPGFRVLHESDQSYERGVKLYASRPDKTWSLTDCISFMVMEREGIREALTGDRHFAQAGFIPVFTQ